MTNEKKYMDTLSEQMNYLKKNGFTEEFNIEGNYILSSNGNKYNPEDLLITETYRFEGESNPADSSELFAIVTNDNKKGILVSAFGAKLNNNAETLKRIKYK